MRRTKLPTSRFRNGPVQTPYELEVPPHRKVLSTLPHRPDHMADSEELRALPPVPRERFHNCGIGNAEQRTTNWSLKSSTPEATRTIQGTRYCHARPVDVVQMDTCLTDTKNSRVLSNSPDFAVGDTSFSSASVSSSSFLVVARFFADSCAFPDDVSLEALERFWDLSCRRGSRRARWCYTSCCRSRLRRCRRAALGKGNRR